MNKNNKYYKKHSKFINEQIKLLQTPFNPEIIIKNTEEEEIEPIPNKVVKKALITINKKINDESKQSFGNKDEITKRIGEVNMRYDKFKKSKTKEEMVIFNRYCQIKGNVDKKEHLYEENILKLKHLNILLNILKQIKFDQISTDNLNSELGETNQLLQQIIHLLYQKNISDIDLIEDTVDEPPLKKRKLNNDTSIIDGHELLQNYFKTLYEPSNRTNNININNNNNENDK
eukprot:TRINITY_DN2635_c4_g1_i1.p1 TRINITY_DN2635_c4_g1~~TRINITY_DN2635_c4_g1_i1.p1  ORF type:complete len:231 (+),score=51.28 TRINITY_DN2635_c4_g1_i1:54-746(+)